VAVMIRLSSSLAAATTTTKTAVFLSLIGLLFTCPCGVLEQHNG
jgi:hypothetical protein